MNTRPHVIFYDDSCALCDSEIEHYKKIKPRHEIDWIGIHSRWDDVRQFGFSKDMLLRRIHAVRSDGSVISGASVFVLIWNSLGYYHWLGKFVTICRLTPMLDFFYKHFAVWRYNKNQQCKVN